MHEADGAAATPEVSVIVPVHNQERYLGKCLEGLLAQTLQSMEVLLVDDGSTDASPQLLAQAAAQDARVHVITRTSAGYGTAVNVGLYAARGRYVGIVEARDLVDTRMYEELLAATRLPKGGHADVVRCPYWEYHDPEDGSEPFIEPSARMGAMPEEPRVFTVHEDATLLLQHPAIWAGLYRREFLEACEVRMCEAPGAAWAALPFLFETLVQARSIAWVPAALYLRRQENQAHPYLGDYRIPFERMRDVRGLLERIGEDDPAIHACLYNREFECARLVQERFGFPETDEVLFGLIEEMLGTMDAEVLYGGHTCISRHMVGYYEDVMGVTARAIKVHKRVKKPRLSVVVALHNVRPYVIGCLQSLAEQTLDSLEVIVTDCGSTDRSAACAEYFAAKDGRFTLQQAGELSVPEALEAGAARARGQVLLFVDPRTRLDKKVLARIARAFDECPHADLLLFGERFSYLPARLLGGHEVPEKHAIEVKAASLRERLMVAVPNAITTKALRASFFRELPLHFVPGEGSGCPLASTKAIAHAQHVALMREKGVRRQTCRPARAPQAGAQLAATLEEERKEKLTLIAAYTEQLGDAQMLRGFRCYGVEAILHDLAEIGSAQDERGYLMRMRGELLGPDGLLRQAPHEYFNIGSYHRLQRLSYQDCARYEAQSAAGNRKTAAGSDESGPARMGRKLAELGPKALTDQLGSLIAKRP